MPFTPLFPDSTSQQSTDSFQPLFGNQNQLGTLPKPNMTLGQMNDQSIQQRGQAVYGNITGTSPESQGEDPLTRGLQATGNAFGAITDVGGNIAKSLFHHLVPDSIQQNIKNYQPGQSDQMAGINSGVLRNPIKEGASKAYDELGIRLNDFITKYPDVGKAIETALKRVQASGEISGGILTADQAAKTIQAGVDVADKGITTIKNKVQDKAQNYAENSLKSEWEKPTQTARAGYKKPTQIYQNATDKGHDISDTLVKNKIAVQDNITDGRFDTVDTANSLREDTQKLSKDLLRPSLEKADLTTPRTPVSDVIDAARDNVYRSSATQEVKESLIDKLTKSEAALTRQYPEGFTLTDLHDEKIIRDLGSKYNVLSDIGTTQEALKNKALADSLRNALETNAPAELPVHDFNAELSKQFQAADYLESLNGKTAPVSNLRKAVRFGAKIAGAGAGEAATGGILGGVGGYQLGGVVERMVENMPNPVKAAFLKNLETTNPEVFQAVQDYLSQGAEGASQMSQPISTASSNINIDNGISDFENKVKDTLKKPPKFGLSIEDVSKGSDSISSYTDRAIKLMKQISEDPDMIAAHQVGPVARQAEVVLRNITDGLPKAFPGEASNKIVQILNKLKPEEFTSLEELGHEIDNAVNVITKGKLGANVISAVQPRDTIGRFANKTIHPEDLSELSDFTDYVAGTYKPKTTQIVTDARRIAVKYGLITKEKAKTIGDKALSSLITKSGIFKK